MQKMHLTRAAESFVGPKTYLNSERPRDVHRVGNLSTSELSLDETCIQPSWDWEQGRAGEASEMGRLFLKIKSLLISKMTS